ncbi:MAG: hypothetical protein KH329_07920, partial [Bifidobacterium longum]|nr:hypothetical protein [Bifidobacterium longum]
TKRWGRNRESHPHLLVSAQTAKYFPSDLARIKMSFQWEDSRMLYGLQMIDMALFMCGRTSGIDSAKKLNDGDKAVLKIVDVIRPPS